MVRESNDIPVLVIGAGPVGLAMARSLKNRGIKYDQVEADDEVGGNWYHGVYKTAHIVACKDVMEYPSYPMPFSYPDFPSAAELAQYYIDYANHHGLRQMIRFNTTLKWVHPIEENLWKAWFEDGTTNIYRSILVCNGHHWSRRFPEVPGSHTFEYIHSKDYKTPDQLAGKRVLVIGSGNSGCDIVCEAARVGKSADLSMRRGIWIFPKYFMGKPLGRIQLPKLPGFIERTMLKWLIRLTFGKHEDYGLPEPKIGYYDRHPTVNQELPYYLKHGRINVRPDIDRFEGDKVIFRNGNSGTYDLVVAATGFKLAFPFLPPALARVEDSHLKTCGPFNYPDVMGLYFVGWQQIRGGVGSLIEPGAEKVCDLLQLEEHFQVPAGKVLDAFGIPLSDTHLMGSRDFFGFIRKFPLTKLNAVASKLRQAEGEFRNEVIPDPARDIEKALMY